MQKAHLPGATNQEATKSSPLVAQHVEIQFLEDVPELSPSSTPLISPTREQRQSLSLFLLSTHTVARIRSNRSQQEGSTLNADSGEIPAPSKW